MSRSIYAIAALYLFAATSVFAEPNRSPAVVEVPKSVCDTLIKFGSDTYRTARNKEWNKGLLRVKVEILRNLIEKLSANDRDLIQAFRRGVGRADVIEKILSEQVSKMNLAEPRPHIVCGGGSRTITATIPGYDAAEYNHPLDVSLDTAEKDRKTLDEAIQTYLNISVARQTKGNVNKDYSSERSFLILHDNVPASCFDVAGISTAAVSDTANPSVPAGTPPAGSTSKNIVVTQAK